MTKQEALDGVEFIKEHAFDDAVPHLEDDELRNLFIFELSRRDDDIGEIARILLSTNAIDFFRWYS